MGIPQCRTNWCSGNAQICKKTDTLKGSIEIASATALFYLEKDVSLYPKERFPNIEKAWSKKISNGAPPLYLHPSIFFRSVWHFKIGHDRGL